jgi:hypothetical protein
VTGTVRPGDEGRYLLVPFDVRPGTARLDIDYTWSALPPEPPPSPLTETVLDLGLWDEAGYRAADGFRGWSGSRHRHVFIEAGRAQRGYRPGPIGPGTWHVELGVGAVGPTGASWAVTVRAEAPPPGRFDPGPAPEPDPVDPAHVARAQPGWYHGDLHAHAWHSSPDGPAPDDVPGLARAAGLDFVAVTEYVVGRHWQEYGRVQRDNPDVVIWPGREIVTYHGHVQSLGETPGFIEYRHGFEDVTVGAIQASVRAAGALFGVNHPTTFPGPLFRAFCRGCAFELGGEIDWDAVDTLELLTGPALVDPRGYGFPDLGAPLANPFSDAAVAVWERLLDAGHRVTGVCGSDDKRGSAYGCCATAVYAAELSRPALADAIRAGRVYVRTRGVAASPALELEAVAPDASAGTFGSTFAVDGRDGVVELRVTVSGGGGQVLRLMTTGGEADRVLVDGDRFEHAFACHVRPGAGSVGAWYRVETADARGRTTIGNPVFVRER